jgi:hypothetical protein
VLDFGIDDESLKGAAAVVQGNVFVVARRGFEARLCPLLRLNEHSEKSKKDDASEEPEGKGKSLHHGENSTCTG